LSCRVINAFSRSALMASGDACAPVRTFINELQSEIQTV
jgi:hypothetical protein